MSGERVYDGSHIAVEIRDGREVVVHGPAVAIVAVDRRERIVLVRQHRAGAGAPLLELPAGNLDKGEPPETAARRELAEETGLHGGEWTEVAAGYTSPGFCDERMHLFVAHGLKEGEANPEGSEELEIVRVAVAELPGRLREIDDVKTLAGLLFYLHDRRPTDSAA